MHMHGTNKNKYNYTHIWIQIISCLSNRYIHEFYSLSPSLSLSLSLYIYIYIRWVQVTPAVTLEKLHLFQTVDL